MHVHNVSSYAPPGHKLARTEYEGGRTKHVFCLVDAPSSEIALECIPDSEAAERGALELFRELHTPKAPVPGELAALAAEVAWDTPKAPSVYERPVTVADLSHPGTIGPVPALSTSAKPSRKRS